MTTIEKSTAVDSQTRRDLLLGAAAIATTLTAGTSFAANEHDHSAHQHNSKANTDIVDAALDCLKTGQACNDHCIDLIKSGDTSLANCMDTLTETLAMCNALAQMASYQSSRLPEVAKICISVCEDCEKECRKHEKKHEICKACADSCNECIEACKKVTA